MNRFHSTNRRFGRLGLDRIFSASTMLSEVACFSYNGKDQFSWLIIVIRVKYSRSGCQNILSTVDVRHLILIL